MAPCRTIRLNLFLAPPRWWAITALCAAALSACGGGSDTAAPSQAVAGPLASGTTTLENLVVLDDTVGSAIAQPQFHIAPVFVEPPQGPGVAVAGDGAQLPPVASILPPQTRSLSTRRLTPDELLAAQRGQPSMEITSQQGTPTPLASGSIVTYTPAQVRAAYGFPGLAPYGSPLTPAQAAQMGAGQTIYVVNAYHNPNVATELATFNQRFGLPNCTGRILAPAAPLPMPAASSTGCELLVAYSDTSGQLAARAPAYNAGWATEIALDVQWSHAIAPLARIVLIEAPDASTNSLLRAVQLANAMGPGVLSMSFGTAEGSWTTSVDSVFGASQMTYLAATGDWGAGVLWPSVSSKVLAVGGTSLSYSGAGSRSEVAWSGTGGGISAYVPASAYQQSGVPGVGGLSRRTVADVAMNADPSTGHYLAVIPSGGTAVQWVSAGGTSLSSPMWAGLVAVANAMRAQSALAPLGSTQPMLYGKVAATPTSYSRAFADITSGSHGSCATCSARAGFDELTGLGTPNATDLLSALGAATPAAVAPVVAAATISGDAGKALSFTVSATGSNPLSYSLASAPAGMAVAAATGIVTWTAPVAGSYAITARATDTKTGLTGQAAYTVRIAPAQPPVVTGASISGTANVALSFSAAATAPHPVSYSLVSAPSGMVIGTTGLVSWPKPVAGNYSVTVVARDTATGLSGSAVFTVKVAPAGTAGADLAITAAAVQGKAGVPLSATISVSAPGATSVSVSLSGVPLGMVFTAQGSAISMRWAQPVAGSYALLVVARDSLGRSAQATMPVTITAP